MPSKLSLFLSFRFCFYVGLILSVFFETKEIQLSASLEFYPLYLIIKERDLSLPTLNLVFTHKSKLLY